MSHAVKIYDTCIGCTQCVGDETSRSMGLSY